MTSAAQPGLTPETHPTKPMAGPATPLSVLGAQCEDERARIRKNFEHGACAKTTRNLIWHFWTGDLWMATPRYLKSWIRKFFLLPNGKPGHFFLPNYTG